MSNQAATERATMDSHDLYLQLDRYVADNRSSHRVEHRWLAAQIEQVRALVLNFKSGGVESLTEEQQQSVRDFRLGEIEDAKERLARDTAALDQEARKLRSTPTKAA